MTDRAIAAVRRIDSAIIEEAQAVRAEAVRRRRPIVAAAADIAKTATVVAVITRSRIPASLI